MLIGNTSSCVMRGMPVKYAYRACYEGCWWHTQKTIMMANVHENHHNDDGVQVRIPGIADFMMGGGGGG